MKTESSFLYFLRISLTLLVITTVVAALLAGVNAVTDPEITKKTAEKTRQAVEAVLPGGGELMDANTYSDPTGLVTAAYKSEAGYAVQVAPSGFGGIIDMLVGIDREGRVLAVSIISHAETPSLGAVAAADNGAGAAFRGSFIGLSGEIKVSKDGGQADTITGATVTSRAVAAGVSAAVEFAAGLDQGGD